VENRRNWIKLVLSRYLKSVVIRRGWIKFKNLFRKWILKSVSLDKYLDCGSSLECI